MAHAIANSAAAAVAAGGQPPANNPPAQNAPVQPSDAFKQTQNAQQVPSPMGVMPSSGSTDDGKSDSDKIMDNIIGDFKSRNPF